MTGSGRELGVSREHTFNSGSFPPSVSTDWEWANVLPLPSFQLVSREQIAYQQMQTYVQKSQGTAVALAVKGHVCHASRKQERSSVDL